MDPLASFSPRADEPAHTKPFWTRPAAPDLQPLDRDAHTQVLVIGAGIAGLTTAHLLATQGRQVMVVDAHEVGGTMSMRTTAHLVTALDDRLAELQRLHGKKNARLAAQGHAAAIDQVEQLVQRLNIDCDFCRVPGHLISHKGAAGADDLKREQQAAKDCGLDTKLLPLVPVGQDFAGSALTFANQAQLDIGAYLGGLLQALLRQGVTVHPHTAVRGIDTGWLGRGSVRVSTANGRCIRADQVVVATNAPINSRFELPLKQEAHMTYVIAATWPEASTAPFLLWDDLSAYHYVRLARSSGSGAYDTLIVGGEDHKVGQAQDAQARYAALEAWMRKHFPQAGAITHRWAGEVMEPIDGLGFMGRTPDVRQGRQVHVITGDSGNGMTHGTLGAMIVSDLIMGKRNPYARLFSPRRRNPRGLPFFMKAGANVQWQYRDLITPGEVSDESQIAAGEGAVMRHGLHKIAVYRDEAGTLHRCSALCPHLAGVVRWNGDDQTWDCPCHGSRFDAHGKVFQGPANRDLAPAPQ